MECFVEAEDEDEAMQKYGDGESEDPEYVEFMSIEEMKGNDYFPRLATQDVPRETDDVNLN